MLFSRARNIDYDRVHISTISGSCIARVTEFKYLGVLLCEKFTFKVNVDNLASKLWQKIGFLYRNKTSFPLISRRRVIEAVFLSVLDYADVIYRHAAASTLKSLHCVSLCPQIHHSFIHHIDLLSLLFALVLLSLCYTFLWCVIYAFLCLFLYVHST